MDSLKEIRESLETIFKDELKLYKLKFVEKSAILLGVIATFFVVLIFFFLGIIFGSLALANFLNEYLAHPFMGFFIVGGGDILLAVLILVLVLKRKIPLLTSLFVKILVNIFNIQSDEDI